LETGELVNLTNRHSQARKGDVAGHVDWQGYRAVKIDGYKYSAARLIWMWMTGEWHEVDHINLQRADDRWVNLRKATRSQNCANKGVFYKPNKYGFRGVKRISRFKYAAVIAKDGKEEYIGAYGTPELAALAYDVAAKRVHGEFARFNFPDTAHRDWLVP
jgi:hypothetical protein